MSVPLHLYAHGKLLLSGEYFVLDGAAALAIPTRWGQHLRAQKINGKNNLLYWVALNSKGAPWLNLVFDRSNFSCVNDDTEMAKNLSRVLIKAQQMSSSSPFDGQHDYAVETQLEFPNQWGLGSSSTFIALVAQWFSVDAHHLLQDTMGGSGYDVACAISDTPIRYCLLDGKPKVEAVAFFPSFAEHLFFVYTGQKQLSTVGIAHYNAYVQNKTASIARLSRITEGMLQCENLEKFAQLIEEHEDIVSHSLGLPKVKQQLFPDYWGSVKSLGAWGGDYVLLVNTRNREELIAYLQNKNLHTCFRFDEMVFRTEHIPKSHG